ncbi:SpoIIE family protein phosphatase [Geomonas subterranea]|uniref:SpoIIE family protein phosphatase n=1 Tax=Geomonas subterranea TaxID=2847989 RepID=A0ABX8LMB1_9BACT|nr:MULTISPECIES: SpoIIE family protein phosphatase [Geomonas]QXE91769.1 SpoIIE family protein phosphatase [Geomonas subterranea]QXM10138.1 SpoIIE family protein phosphatase [Geomonas subterranea]
MGKPLRVLIVEDSEDDALLLIFELRRGNYAPVSRRVETAEAMRKALEEEDWDLVVSDYVLPGFTGLEALQVLRDSGLDIPFIIVSGKIGEDTAVGAMKEGANDYLIKGNTSRLIPAIEREMQEAQVRRKKREAESALVRSERRYKRLVAAVTDYIYTVTIKEGEVVKTSHGPGCLSVTGYSDEEYQQNPFLWYQMIHEDDRAAVTSLTEELRAGNEIPSLEHRIRHKDGSLRWVINTVVPRYSEQGDLVAYDGLISDISERKQAEESLRVQSAALEAAANAIVITDSSGVVLSVNDAFTRMTGYTLEESAGRDLSFLKSERQDPELYRDLWSTIMAGKIWHGELVNRRKNGELYPEEQTITPVLDQDGRIRHFICIKQDITERKLAEQALLQNTSMRKEMEIARQIQLSLLPAAPPLLTGIDCAGRCVPASHIGGDYYDILLHGERLDLVIADVSGHSVGAALIMVETRSVLRAQMPALDGPAQVVAALNEILHDDLSRAELFITMSYLSYHRTSGKLSYSNAGHPPPLLYRPGEERFFQLDAEGLILGVQRRVAFDEPVMQVEKGDLLLLYTDGITEAQNHAGELFGVQRLKGVLAREHRKPSAAIIDAVLDALRAFAGSASFEDDISMLLLKFIP